jgi:hypothetical protein
MASSPYDLALMAAHDMQASRAFPGPDFREVLAWLHEDLRPATYVEIGIHSGCSLAAVGPGTLVVGIDPSPRFDAGWPQTGRIFPLTSTQFFAAHNLSRILGGKPVDFAFVDGLHRFEQTVEDLWNLERYLARNGVIAVHDTIPLDAATSARTRTTEFYTGDVWKVLPYLQRHRPELEAVTVTAAPSGLSLIRGFDPARRPASRAGCDEFAALGFDYFERNRDRFLRTIPNVRSAIQAFCQKTPVQSIASTGASMPSR